MDRLCLVSSEYDSYKERMILYFSKDPLSKTNDFIYKEVFHPSVLIDLPQSFLKTLLFEFKKDITIREIAQNKTKIIAKNYTLLKLCAKIIQQSTNHNLLLIEPERQFLINNNWSYYDSFVILHRNKIKKINNEDQIHFAIKEFVKNIDDSKKIESIEPLTKKLVLSNFLKTKPEKNITSNQILNTLFENYFFLKNITLSKKSRINYNKKEFFFPGSLSLDFTAVWPHLLTNKFYNIGYETTNCNCCKPKDLNSTNIFSNSLVEVEFLRSGFYFISGSSKFAYSFHKDHEKKENRLNFKYQNKLKDFPIGPFNKGEKSKILLSDAVNLVNDNDIKILESHELNWYCKKQESFISIIIKDLLQKLKRLEESINITTTFNYSSDFSQSGLLERNPNFLEYLTEYSLINNLLEEIPLFLQNTNTKFYDPKIEGAIESIKQKTITDLNQSNNNRDLFMVNEKIISYNKSFLAKINDYFPKLNLPIPKLIC